MPIIYLVRHSVQKMFLIKFFAFFRRESAFYLLYIFEGGCFFWGSKGFPGIFFTYEILGFFMVFLVVLRFFAIGMF